MLILESHEEHQEELKTVIKDWIDNYSTLLQEPEPAMNHHHHEHSITATCIWDDRERMISRGNKIVSLSQEKPAPPAITTSHHHVKTSEQAKSPPSSINLTSSYLNNRDTPDQNPKQRDSGGEMTEYKEKTY